MKKVFGTILLVVLVLVGFLEHVPNASAAVDWVAYNDAGGSANFASTGNVTNYSFTQASAANLLKYADGTSSGVTVAFAGTNNGVYAAADGTYASPYVTSSTDAYNELVGGGTPIINLGYASQVTTTNTITMTLSGVSSAKTYDLVMFGDRGNSTYTTRYTKYTVSGVQSGFVNASSTGATKATTTLANDSTYYCTGFNYTAGYVAKWTGLVPTGTTITVTIKGVDATGASVSMTAYLNAFKLTQNTPTSIVAPTVTASAASTITANGADLNGNITVDGGESATARGFHYGLTASYGSTSTTSGTYGTGAYSQTISGLTCNTLYHYRSFATNSGGTGTSADGTFTTSACSAPTVTASAASTITTTGADLNGNITADGGAAPTARGFYYGTTVSYGSTSSTTGTYTTGTYSQSITGLTCNTLYHYQAFATNSGGTGTATDGTFTTAACPVAPTVTASAASSITTTGATLTGNITATGGENATARGFHYGTTVSYGSTSTTSGSYGTGEYTQDITGLTCNTLYHYRSFATNSGGTGTSSDNTFTTAACPVAPTVTASAASSITTTGATLTGNITATGGENATARGFHYGLTASYGSTSTTSGSYGTGEYTQDITGLSANTIYHYRSFATNSGGTSTSSDNTFTTSAYSVPGAPTSAVATAGNTLASVAFTAPASDGGSPITGYTVTSSPGSFTGTGGTSPIVVSGLTNGTAYTFTVTATNVAGTGSASTASNSVTPAPAAGWVAYNDAGGSGTSPSTGNVTNVAFTTTAATNLVKYSDNTSSGVTVAFAKRGTTGTFQLGVAAEDTASSNRASPYVTSGTDAYNEFVGGGTPIINLGYAGQITTNGIVDMTLSGVSSGKSYDLTLVALRGYNNASYTGRYTKTIVSGVQAGFTNASSTGTTITTTTLTNDTTRYVGGDNYANGYVAKWTGLVPTGTTISVSFQGVDSTGATGVTNAQTAYLNAFKLTENGASSTTVPTVTASAATSVTATGAALNGNITADGGVAPTARGFHYGTTAAYGSTSSTTGTYTTGTYSQSITGLTCNTLYHYRSFATNSAGTATSTDSTFTTSACSAPGAPTSVVATGGNAQASVAFTAPANDGGSAITGYTVTSSPGSFTGTGSASPIVVTGLTNGTAYTFTVTATNAIGTGAASTPSSSITLSTGTGPLISSAASQMFLTGSAAAAISTITVTDNTLTPYITAANDIRIKIPSGFNMVWDSTDTAATIGGAASAHVSGTVSYEDADKTLVINVSENFAVSDVITISGLSFKTFSAASVADNLELEVNNAGTTIAVDDKTISITAVTVSSAANQTFTVADPTTAMSQITVTDSASSPYITATNDIRIKIPAGLDMTWDAAALGSVVIGGAASAKISTSGGLDSPYTPIVNLHRANLHGHTTNSDGAQTASAYMTSYLNLGYSAAAITDHDYFTPNPSVSGITHVRGVENTANAAGGMGDMASFGITSFLSSNRQTQVDTYTSQGGVSSVNHPITGWTNAGTVNLNGYTNMEVFNSHYGDLEPYVDYALSNGKQFWLVANDDLHTTIQIYRAWNELNSSKTVGNLTEADVVNIIKSGDFYAYGRGDRSNAPAADQQYGSLPTPAKFTGITVSGYAVTANIDKSANIQFITKNGTISQTNNSVTTASYTASLTDIYVRVKVSYTSGGKTAYSFSNPIYITESGPAAVSLEDSGKTLVIDVGTNFVAGDAITISGLKFNNFTTAGSGNLTLSVSGSGATVNDTDDKTITIESGLLTPTASITNTPRSYNGSAQTATVACTGGGTATIASGGTGTDAGSYATTVNCAASAGYEAATGLSAGNFVISKATPTASITNTPRSYNGSAQTANVACLGGGAATINTGGTGTNAGSYATTVDCATSTNYSAATGLSAGNFVIEKIAPTASITNSSQPYTGSAQTATVACLGGGTATLASGGTGTDAGSYAATVNCATSTNYSAATGLSAGNFVIEKIAPTASITNTPRSYTGSAQTANVACLGGGAATINTGGTGTSAGSYATTVDCATSTNYSAATGLSAGNFVIEKIAPTASITNTPQSYNGSSQTANVACLGGGTATLASGGTGTDAGSYAATVNCAASTNYSAATGLSAGNFVIEKITPTASITNTPQSYNGSSQTANVACLGGGTATLASGGTGTDAGSYATTVDCATSTNYSAATGLSAGNFVISKATPTASITNTPRSYNGSAQTATVACTGGGAATINTGGTGTSAGSYATTVDCVASTNYSAATGLSAGDFVISKATPTASITNTPRSYNGSAQTATVACLGGGAATINTGGTGTNAGTYATMVDCATSTNYSAATGLSAGNFVIEKIAPTASITNTPRSYNGSAQTATVACLGGGAATINTGGTGTNAGTYATTVDCATSTNYNAATGLSAGDFVISKIAPTASITNSSQPYTGSAQTATVACLGGGVATLASGGTGTDAGSYAAIVDCATSTNYSAATGLSAGNFVIEKIAPTASITNSSQPYTGSAQTATVACTGGGAATINTGGTGTSAGSYATTVDCATSTNYSAATGLSAGNFVIEKIAPTASITNSSQPYTGSAQTATVACLGGGVATLASGGTGTDAGSYAATVNCAASTNYNAATGLSAGDFVISKIAPTASITNSPQSYNGSAQTATVACTGGGAATINTGGTGTSAGSYATTVDCVASTNYSAATGLSAGDFVISKATPTASITNTPRSYNGSAQTATVACLGGGAATINTGGTGTNAGTYATMVDCATSTNYSAATGLSAGNFVIEKIAPTASITNSSQPYTGSAQTATVACLGGGVATLASGGTGTDAGSYAAIVDCATSTNYSAATGLSAGNFVIEKIAPTASITNSSQPYTGSAQTATVACTGGGAATINTGGTGTNAGTYATMVDCATSTNYSAATGLSAGNFVIEKIAPTASITNSSQPYTGSAQTATVACLGGGVATLASGGTGTDAGSYAAIVDCATSTNYSAATGLSAGNFVIEKIAPTASITNSSQPYTGSAQTATVACTGGGAATINTGGTGTSAGSYATTVDCVASTNYSAATGLSAGDFVISKATPTASITNTPRSYNGSAQTATVACLGGGAATINTGGTGTNAGTYATMVDCATSTNYSAATGLSAGNFVIEKIAPTASITNSSQPYTGSAQTATVACLGGGVATLASGGTGTDAGSYAAIVDCATSTNYSAATGLSAGNFVIEKIAPTASITNSSQPYTGSAQTATVACTGGGAATINTGGTGTNAGTYATTVDCVASANYSAATGLSAGNFVIEKITPTASITNSSQPYTGSAQTATVACLGGGVATLASGGTGTDAGSYAAIVDCATSTNYSAATGLSAGNFVIEKIAPTASITNSSQPYTGSAQTATVACTGGGAATINTGGTGTSAGSYATTVDCVASTNYSAATGLSAGDFVISKATPTASITNTPRSYNGSAQTATVACLGGGAATINTGGTGTNAGTYATMVDCATSTNYSAATGLSAGNFVIEKITPTASITNSSQPYTGSAQTATVACLGGGAATINTGGTGTNAGSYATTVDCATSTNYSAATGLSAGNFVIEKITPTASITNSSQPYTGSAQTATVACLGGGVATLASGGTGTDAGSYAAIVDCATSTNYSAATGLSAGNFVIEKIAPTASITNSSQPYTGSAQTATVACLGGGVATLASGGTGTDAGSYAATVNCAASTNYNAATGLSAGDFVISKIAPTASITNSPQSYNGSAQTATVACTGGGAATINTGGTGTSAGSYATTVDCVASTNYSAATGLSAGDFVISKATPTASITNTPRSYNGSAQTATVACLGGGVATLASGGTGTDAGSYAATVNCATSTNYSAATGLSAGDFVISKATPTASITNTPQPYTGSSQTATVACLGGGAATLVSGGTGTSVGSYEAFVNCAASANYNAASGLSAGFFIIGTVAPTAYITNSPQLYTGSAQTATVACTGGGVATIALGGVGTNIGSYPTTVNCAASPGYEAATGLDAGSFVISKATPTASIINSPQVYTGSSQTATVACLGGGTATLASGGTGTNAGTYPAIVNCAESTNYNAATGLSAGNFVIEKITPTASITNTPRSYNGSAQTATVVCLGGGTATLASGGTGTNAGTYPAIVNCAASTNYNTASGLSAGDFVISKIAPTASITNTPQPYTGSSQTAAVACLGGGVATIATGGTGTDAGSYATTVDCATSTNYSAATGLSAGNFVISKVTPTASITNTPQSYNGSAQTAVVACLGGGAATINTGGTGTSAGSYATTVDCATSTNYSAATGLSSGNFVISKIAPTASITNSPQSYTGSSQTAAVSCLGGGAATINTGGTGTDAGTYPATVDCATSTNYSAATGLSAGNFVISKATPTASITNSPQPYTGSVQTAIVACSGGGVATLASGGTGTDEGTYPTIVNCAESANYSAATGLSAGDFVIGKINPTASITNTPRSYNGSAQTATVVCTGGGTATINTGGTGTNAGSYATTVDCAASAGYFAATGLSAGNFVIEKIAPTASITNSPRSYTGSAQTANVACLGGGTATINTGGTGTNAGTYATTVDCATSTNYSVATGLSAGNFVISKVTPTASITNSPQTHTGSSQTAAVSCLGGGVATINTGGTGTNAGTYATTVDCATSTNHSAATGLSAGDFVISKATPTASITNSPQLYNGSAQTAVVSCLGGGVATLASGGTGTNAGTYAAVVNCGTSTNYSAATGLSAGNFVIEKITSTASITNSPQTYTGSAQTANVACLGGGAATINTGGTGTNAGSYATTVNCATSTNYSAASGLAAGDFVISKATPTASITNTPQTYTGSAQTANVACLGGGVATLASGGTGTDAGSYAATVNCAESANYSAATGLSAGNFVIGATPVVISVAAIPGVTIPVRAVTPVSTIADTGEYTATITWSPVSNPFAANTVYTATITITPNAGYTLTGIASNFFTVAGTSIPATNSAGSGVVTAVFPATGSAPSSGGGGGGGGGGGYYVPPPIAPVVSVTPPVSTPAPVVPVTPTETSPTPTPAPAVSDQDKFKKNLTYLTTNSDIRELQKYFNANGFIVASRGAGSPGKETDYFGDSTLSTLIKFQEANKDKVVGLIDEKGYFGPITRQLINTIIITNPTPAPAVSDQDKFKKNLTYLTTNSDIRELQKYFNANGFIVASRGAGSPGKETDYFGDSTLSTLIKFQEANKDKVVGLIDEKGYFGPITRQLINTTIITNPTPAPAQQP